MGRASEFYVAPALRVGFLSPSRAGRGGAFRVPRSSKRAGAGGRGVAAAAVAAGGGRLLPQLRQWRWRRQSRGSRERSSECQPAATAQELGVRDARAGPSAAALQRQLLPPPPRA